MRSDSMGAAPAMARPNTQMQNVLDQLESMHPKPIPTLDEVTEEFDGPLTKARVLAIVDPFIV